MFYNQSNFKIKDFCSKSSGRPELTGILITPSKTIATDSFMLVDVESVKANPADFPIIPNRPKMMTNFQSFILPSDKAKDVIKLFKSLNPSLPIVDNAVILRRDKDMVEIAKTDLESCNSVMSRTIQGEFPNTNDIMVERGKYTTIKVNSEFLKRIAGFLNDFTNKNKLKEITIRVPLENDNPVRFFAQNDNTQQKARIVLMPIKRNNE